MSNYYDVWNCCKNLDYKYLHACNSKVLKHREKLKFDSLINNTINLICLMISGIVIKIWIINIHTLYCNIFVKSL